jgi:hypothetical protein
VKLSADKVEDGGYLTVLEDFDNLVCYVMLGCAMLRNVCTYVCLPPARRSLQTPFIHPILLNIQVLLTFRLLQGAIVDMCVVDLEGLGQSQVRVRVRVRVGLFVRVSAT